MFTYIIVILFAILLSSFYKKDDNSKSIIFLFLSFLVLFLFSGLRYNIGYDYSYTYVRLYNYLAMGYEISHYEPLFLLLNKFVFLVFDNVDFVFLISSFLTIGIVYLAIKKQSSIVPLSIFLLIGSRFYFYSFTQVRQYIAIAIFLYAIKYIETKNIKKYMILIIIASLFHKLALAYIPIYFLSNIRLTKKKYITLSILSILVGGLFIPLYSNLATHFFADYNFISINPDSISSVFIIIALFVWILTIFYYDNIKENNYNNIYIIMQLVLMFMIFSTYKITDSYRIVALFSYHTIFLIPNLIKSIKIKDMKFIVLFLIVLLYSFSAILYLKNDTSMIPYTSIFSKYD